MSSPFLNSIYDKIETLRAAFELACAEHGRYSGLYYDALKAWNEAGTAIPTRFVEPTEAEHLAKVRRLQVEWRKLHA